MTPTAVPPTPRLLLREWRPEDLPAFAAMNADPRVMEFYPKLLTPKESNGLGRRMQEHFALHGFGLWAVEAPGVADFIGYVGLSIPNYETPFTPCVEIGWRLAFAWWGRGYATEAARAVAAHAFGPLGLREIVSFTVPANVRSRAVMERLGMTHDPRDDFIHPLLPEGHRLSRHVLYRLKSRPTGG